MAHRCKQCGRSLNDNEGDFCCNGCRNAYSRENPGWEAQELQGKIQKGLLKLIFSKLGCLIIVILIILYFISQMK